MPFLVSMAVSDMRIRKVRIMSLAAFGLTMFVASVAESGFQSVLRNILCNGVVCLILLTALIVWSAIRNRDLFDMVGTGDLVFVAMVTPYFGTYAFTLFLTVSFAVTLVSWSLYRLCNRGADDIPLISGLGVCLISVILYRTVLFLL